MEHEIQLLPNSPLQDIGSYKQSILETDVVKMQLVQLLEQGVIRPRNSLVQLLDQAYNNLQEGVCQQLYLMLHLILGIIIGLVQQLH